MRTAHAAGAQARLGASSRCWRPVKTPRRPACDGRPAASRTAATFCPGTCHRKARAAVAAQAAVVAGVSVEPAREAPAPRQAWLARHRREAQLAAIAALGAALWCAPAPLADITPQAWHLFAIFAPTMVGIVAQPLPSGAMALAGLSATVLTHTLPFPAAFSAFGSEAPWLLLCAAFLAQGFTETGLGSRLALRFVAAFGGHPLGLAYSLVLSEALLAPAIPSVAARSGGMLLPLVTALAQACGSFPAAAAEGESKGEGRQLGAWLSFTLFQTSAVSSSMFLTANPSNPITAQLVGAATGTPVTWPAWAAAAALPGGLCLAAIPALLWALQRPDAADSRPAQALSRRRLAALGPLRGREAAMAGVSGVTLLLWTAGSALGVSAAAAALLGVCLLLACGVLRWEQCLSNRGAWDAFVWFSAVLAFATQLKQTGFVDAATAEVAAGVASLDLGWQASGVLLALAYVYSHYAFASNLSHVSATAAAFLAVATAAGVPPALAGTALAFLSNLMGGISYWGMSHAPLYYSQGYVTGGEWLRLGLAVSVLNLTVFLGVGSLWWRLLDIW